MELRNQLTGEIISETAFRQMNSNTSFPKVINEATFNDFGYDVILQGPQAPVSGPYQRSIRDGVEEVNGQWFTKYVTYTATDADEVAAIDERAATLVRNDRNARLAKSDWTQIPDATVDKPAWATYRQLLRDITTQTDFPHTIEWPEEPTS